MKIIERGTLPSEREWKAMCTNCRTRFECLESEGHVESDQREGTYLRVVCPVCGNSCYGSPK
jgi:RNase P subunit RPR2